MNATTDTNNAPEIVSFHKYDAKNTPDVPFGKRLVTVLYRENKDGEKAGENSYMLVPDHITEEAVKARIDDLAPYVVAMLQKEEDRIVAIDHRAGVTGLAAFGFTLDKIIASLEANGAGTRLTKEQAEGWFDNVAADSFKKLLSERYGYAGKAQLSDNEREKLAVSIATLRAKYAALAGTKTFYIAEEAKILTNALEAAGLSESGLGKRFHGKLVEMQQTKVDDMLSALGL